MTKQSYQIITYKNLFIYLVMSRRRFWTKITAPAKYGGYTAPGSGSTTLHLTHPSSVDIDFSIVKTVSQ